MRSISIQADIEVILTQYARSIPDLFTEFDISEIEVLHSSDEFYDIVRVIDEDNEVILGEVTLSDDFVASFDIFEED